MFRKMGKTGHELQIFASKTAAQLEDFTGLPYVLHQQEMVRSVDEVMFWPVQLARIFGYWPFMKIKGKYTFRWSGTGFWLTLFNFLMLVACLGMVGINSRSMFQPVGREISHSSTESASMWTTVLTQSITVLLLLALTLATRQGLLCTWERISHTVNDVRGNYNQNSALRVNHIPGSSGRCGVNTALAVLFTFSLVRATVRVVEVAHATFYRLEFWKACLCVAALFVWELMCGMTNLWLLTVTGFIGCLTMSCQVLRSQLRTSNEGIQIIGTLPKQLIPLKGLETYVRLHKELRNTIGVMNEELKVPLVAIFILKIVILTVAIFFSVTGMDLSKGVLEYNTIVQLLTIIMDLLSFHYLCSSGTDFTLEAKKFSDALENLLSKHAVDITSNIKNECMRMTVSPSVVSPGHFFTVTNRLMSTVISVLTSYSIVLIQFDDAEEAGSRHCPMTNETKH